MNRFVKYLLFLTVVLLSACNAQKQIVYMQDLNNASKLVKVPELTIQPQDMLSIVVSSKEPEMA
jgi:polysaccharide export outer membrane protein